LEKQWVIAVRVTLFSILRSFFTCVFVLGFVILFKTLRFFLSFVPSCLLFFFFLFGFVILFWFCVSVQSILYFRF